MSMSRTTAKMLRRERRQVDAGRAALGMPPVERVPTPEPERYIREGGSHVNDDGTAKQSYLTRDEAESEARHILSVFGSVRVVYVCAQKPEHYHLSKNVRLVVDNYAPAPPARPPSMPCSCRCGCRTFNTAGVCMSCNYGAASKHDRGTARKVVR